MRRLAVVVSIALVAGCNSSPPGAVNDLDQTYTKTITPPSHHAIDILFGKPGAFICKGVHESLWEISHRVVQPHPYKKGFFYFDVVNNVSSYRAYFKKPSIKDSPVTAFVLCSGAGAQLSGQSCGLAGVKGQECFETSTLGWNDSLKDIQSIIEQAQTQ